MPARFDPETIERFRAMSTERILEAVKDAAYGAGPVGSEDFLDLYEQLVEAGVLSWEQVEKF